MEKWPKIRRIDVKQSQIGFVPKDKKSSTSPSSPPKFEQLRINLLCNMNHDNTCVLCCWQTMHYPHCSLWHRVWLLEPTLFFTFTYCSDYTYFMWVCWQNKASEVGYKTRKISIAIQSLVEHLFGAVIAQQCNLSSFDAEQCYENIVSCDWLLLNLKTNSI